MKKTSFVLASLACLLLFTSIKSEAFNCYVTGLQCEVGANGNVISWTDIVCDGTCNACPFVYVYRQSASPACPEAKHLIGKPLVAGEVFVDTAADGNMCYIYTVEIRRNC